MNEDIIAQKNALRMQIKAINKALPESDRMLQMQAIHRHLTCYKPFVKSKVAVFYWPIKNEVSTIELIEHYYSTKLILLPVIEGDTLVMRPYRGKEYMAIDNIFGIPEPIGDDFCDLDRIDFIVVPGLAFDLQGNRLGRGKGYYDRLLQNLQHACKIGVGYEHQLVDCIPTEIHDIRLNGICIPEGIFNIQD